MQGWVKLHRKILDNPIICKDSEYFSVWCYLILNATHAEYDVEFKNERITLKSGQLITGRKSISEKFNISDSKVQRILKKLEIEQQIEQQTTTKNRLISIVNWDQYQKSEQQDEQTVNNERTTSEQPVNTNKNVKKIKNDNNVKNKYGEYKNVSLNNEEYKRLLEEQGQENLDKIIDFFDKYIEEKGYKSKSHNLAIRRWVIDAVVNQTKLFDVSKPKQFKTNNAVEDFFGGMYGTDNQQSNSRRKSESEDNSTIDVGFSECED